MKMSARRRKQRLRLSPLPPKHVLHLECPKADDDCGECHGYGVTPTSQGNRVCSRCETTEGDLVWSMVPNPARRDGSGTNT